MSNKFVDSLTNTNDLRTHRFKAVYVSGSFAGSLVSSLTQGVYGVLDSLPNSGEDMTVVIGGSTRFFAGGTITAGARITVNVSATFVVANSGDQVYGIAKEAVSSGSYFRGKFGGGLGAEAI